MYGQVFRQLGKKHSVFVATKNNDKKKKTHFFSSANVNTVWVVVNSDSQRPLSAHAALRG